jgi:uncharacterized protein YjbI with pentapeptide repeats
MSDQDGRQAAALPHPATEDIETWKAYWQAQGLLWRTEPEIDIERQKYLDERRKIAPDIAQGVYPFKEIKLSRADVEWLLATHEGGRGPVDWSDMSQRQREGLDLRGANLCYVDLQNLPLTRIRGGITQEEWFNLTYEQYHMGLMLLEKAKLSRTHLEGAILHGVRLEKARLYDTYLENADLSWAHLEGSLLNETHLAGADLRGVYFDSATHLSKAIFGDKQHGYVLLADAHWNDMNLSTVDWTQLKILGDEREARKPKESDNKVKDKITRLDEYESALRANRQLSNVLQAQGLDEAAVLFAYRAHKIKRIILRRQKKFGQYFFSVLLDTLAGYGYLPLRSIFWYLAIIFAFALAYYGFGHLSLWPPDAFVYSLTSFHGRGFFPGLEGVHSLHNPLIMFAAIEAVVGLFIEISFIATFTQRFFGK